MSLLTAFKNKVFVILLTLMACGSSVQRHGEPPENRQDTEDPELIVAANRTESYFPLLENKAFALVANQTSVIFTSGSGHRGSYVHLADSLVRAGLNLKKVFAPEHGFRGRVDAGEKVTDGKDPKTGLPVLSLYGSNRKPGAEQLEGLDLVVFDIQDVGVRFYTYIATLQLVMEACAEAGIPVLVLDRPNPNAHYVDGPVMEKAHRSFLGMTDIPLVYGMTIGEYAQMINEEGWLENGRKAALRVIPLQGYARNRSYELPIPPSPNLPNAQSVRLYPSLGLFEGTYINAGRGTPWQFQLFGAPFLSNAYFEFSYVPEPGPGASNPKHKGERCYGRDLRNITPPDAVSLQWILEAYTHREAGAAFFNTPGFTKHAGTEQLQEQIEDGWDEDRIRASWKASLDDFKKIWAKYLRYD